VPYRWGGNSKKGIDCSAFVKKLYESVHEKNIPRTSRDQYKAVTKVKREDLMTGDLLFFKSKRGVWHVGYYMFDSLFAHSSVGQKGVGIGSLKNSAYSKMWFSQGRFD
jgi:lipoprotein Spr